MHRDSGYYWLRLAMYLILAFGLGTIYYNIGLTYESIQVCMRGKREKERERDSIQQINVSHIQGQPRMHELLKV